METEIVAFVAERAARSIIRLEGLRAALLSAGMSELAGIAEAVRRDASSAHRACGRSLRLTRERRTNESLADLQTLVRTHPESWPTVLKVAKDLQLNADSRVTLE